MAIKVTCPVCDETFVTVIGPTGILFAQSVTSSYRVPLGLSPLRPLAGQSKSIAAVVPKGRTSSMLYSSAVAAP
jgi:hypothetical protein